MPLCLSCSRIAYVWYPRLRLILKPNCSADNPGSPQFPLPPRKLSAAACYDGALTGASSPTMFDFIFKRRNGTPSTVASSPVSSPTKPRTAEAAQVAAQSKQAALLQAEALDGNEAAAVEFILQCEFADARAIAARHVVSLPMLEQALLPMRKTDRRVARLLQQRLDTLAHQQRVEQQVQAWLARAQGLLLEAQLLPNQVAELDRNWQAIGTVQPVQDAYYQPVRSALSARLLAQAALQRAALDTLTHLRQLQQTIEDASPLPPAEEVTRALGILEGAMENHFSAPDAISLPRHVRADFEQQRTSLRESWQVAQQYATALMARQHLVSGWEEAAPEALDGAELQRLWQGLPAIKVGEEANLLQTRWQNLLQKIDDATARPDPRIRPDEQLQSQTRQQIQGRTQQQTPHQARQQIDAALTAMEVALDEGALQHALDCDNTLRGFDVLPNLLPAVDAARLRDARAELSRLQGWARWGGNISRIELLKVAQELPDQHLTITELAKQVGALRARWKALDVSAGVAPKALWQQFDAVCTVAYAPAAEHFNKLIEQRRQNLVAAQVLIEQVRAFTADWPEPESAPELEADSVGAVTEVEAARDWKAVALFCTRSKQAWQRLGNLEHKERKQLQRDFDDALRNLQRPLALQQANEVQQREQLITAVQALNPTERGAPDALRDLQQRWQQRAKTLPLEHHQEEALWQRFRTVCDQMFATRKQASANADGERRANLQAKQALCQELEMTLKRASDSALDPMPADLAQQIVGMAAAWDRIGSVPRTQEVDLEQRRAAALALGQEKLQAASRRTRQAGVEALRRKLTLCQTLEWQFADPTVSSVTTATEAQACWAALPLLTVEFEGALGHRFEAIQAASGCDDRAYVAQLEKNRVQLLSDILRLEIINGLASPAELATQRLQVQVTVLAAKLKNGDSVQASQQQWLALCALPALTDADAALRMEQLLQRYAELSPVAR